MVHIVLPIEIGVGAFGSAVEVLGKIATFTETPLQIAMRCIDVVSAFRSAFQYREGVPQDTVNVQIQNSSLLHDTLVDLFINADCVTNTSVEQVLVDHLSESLIGHFTTVLGLQAATSLVTITPTEEFYNGLAGSLVQALQSNADMRQILYEQFLTAAPERFSPGKDDTFQPIPFEAGDSVAFYLQLTFTNAVINGNPNMPLSMFLDTEEMPNLRHIIIMNIES